MKMPKLPRILKHIAFLFFLFCCAEFSLRFLLSVEHIEQRMQGEESYYMKRSWKKRASTSEHKINYVFDTFNQHLGWFSIPNIKNLPFYPDKFVSTNSVGLRGTREYPISKAVEGKRVLILGDSFSFGEGVSDHEVFSAKLEEKFDGWEFINLAVHGYGHDQMLIALKEYGLKYKPDLVLVGFLSMDMDRNLLWFRDYAKPYFKIVDGKLNLKNSPVPSPEETLKKDFYRTRFIDLWHYFKKRYESKKGIRYRQSKNITRHIIKEICNTAVESGSDCLLAFLPYGEEIKVKNMIHDHFKMLTNISKTSDKIYATSLKNDFHVAYKNKKISEKEIYEHYSATGHQIVAEGIERFLREHY